MKAYLWLAGLALGVAAVSASAAAEPAPAPAPQEARIPFVDHGGIRDWRAADGDTLYVQDAHRRWYRAELMHRATGLPFALAIGFDTGAVGSLDRFSAIVVDGQRIPLRSLVRVDGPPPKREAREEA